LALNKTHPLYCEQRHSNIFCFIALIYKLQAGKNDIKEIKLPGELGGAELENKIIMLTDDTQLFIKYERYVEKLFNVFSKYEQLFLNLILLFILLFIYLKEVILI
jgi:hypothetical protein